LLYYYFWWLLQAQILCLVVMPNCVILLSFFIAFGEKMDE